MTDADTDTDTDIDDDETNMSELAERVIDELDPGQTIGDKIVLSRRQLVAIAGGGLSLGALGTFGVSDAQAQTAVGTIGTSSSPVDVEAFDLAVQGALQSPLDVNGNNLTDTNAVDYNGVTPDYKVGEMRTLAQGSKGTTSNTSYQFLFDFEGQVDLSDIPNGMILYARFMSRVSIDDADETVFARPTVFDLSESTTVTLSPVEVSHTGDTAGTFVDSGWQDISGTSATGIIGGCNIQGRVSDGTATGTINSGENTLLFAGVTQ